MKEKSCKHENAWTNSARKPLLLKWFDKQFVRRTALLWRAPPYRQYFNEQHSFPLQVLAWFYPRLFGFVQGGRWVQSCICTQLNLKWSPWNGYYAISLYCQTAQGDGSGAEEAQWNSDRVQMQCLRNPWLCALWSAKPRQVWGDRAFLSSERSEDWLHTGHEKETWNFSAALTTTLLREKKC